MAAIFREIVSFARFGLVPPSISRWYLSRNAVAPAGCLSTVVAAPLKIDLSTGLRFRFSPRVLLTFARTQRPSASWTQSELVRITIASPQ